jgi:hypothetical protein
MPDMDRRSGHVAKAIRRKAFGCLTELRAARLKRGLTLFEVAYLAGISSYRTSLIERGLDDGTPEEIMKLRQAIERLAREREGA